MGEDELLLEIFCGDFIERTRGNLRGSNAQILRLGENFFVLEAKLL
jgi:hypothetical protein